ncbi:hypothetical protein [Pectobacterium parmentieri]|uniref:hypothetical protein n=1 Tax=Pectobacterium parmentieri TaxID=1905730 RepID=UPI0013C4F569|nr:hypothetical protein [Pectobacterium parmentieri]
MITLAIAIYAFMAGMVAEWMHTMLKKAGKTEYPTLCALFWGCLWPVTLWRMIA